MGKSTLASLRIKKEASLIKGRWVKAQTRLLWIYLVVKVKSHAIKNNTDMTLKDELPMSVGTQYATGEEWRNSSRNNEETEPKQKLHLVVDVTGDGSKV